ncbi:hypothetical protein SEVIR_9G571201v4 [Setaria viridis]
MSSPTIQKRRRHRLIPQSKAKQTASEKHPILRSLPPKLPKAIERYKQPREPNAIIGTGGVMVIAHQIHRMDHSHRTPSLFFHNSEATPGSRGAHAWAGLADGSNRTRQFVHPLDPPPVRAVRCGTVHAPASTPAGDGCWPDEALFRSKRKRARAVSRRVTFPDTNG